MKVHRLFTILVVLALAVVIALTLQAVIATQAVVSDEQALKVEYTGGQAPQNASTPSAPAHGSTQAAPVPNLTPETTVPRLDNSPAIRLLAGTYTNANRTFALQITSDGVITWTSRIDAIGTRYTFTLAGDTLLVSQPSCVAEGNHARPLRAAYKWALAGDSLTLSPIGDTCERRRHDLASVRWIRKTIWLV
jgi:hypothetical protein